MRVYAAHVCAFSIDQVSVVGVEKLDDAIAPHARFFANFQDTFLSVVNVAKQLYGSSHHSHLHFGTGILPKTGTRNQSHVPGWLGF